MNIFSLLTEQQKKAAFHREGPLLLLSGAGAGKTLTLTARIIALIESGVHPENILALTFTNKAAREMKERIEKYSHVIPQQVGTFHSIFYRFLKREIHRLGRSNGFTLYDTQDQESLIKNILKAHYPDIPHTKAKQFLSAISSLKNSRILSPDARSDIDPQISGIFSRYNTELQEANAVDFDDLLLLPSIIFEMFPDVKEHYSRIYQYILVDEYQDTNTLQYVLLTQLTSTHKNLCVIGDPDQSIYGFRGAKMENILQFPSEYTGANVIELSTNFRSTRNIVNASNSLIQNNEQRFEKEMKANGETGESLKILTGYHSEDEAREVAASIERRIFSGSSQNDIAILFRTNAQSRAIEEYLLAYHIPYTVIGGLKFYARKEIKDILAYLRCMLNPSDIISFQRMISVPSRGIGQTSIQRLQAFAQQKELDITLVMNHIDAVEGIRGRSKTSIRQFCELFEILQSKAKTLPLSQYIEYIAKESGMLDELRRNKELERIENIEELIRLAERFDMHEAEGLSLFLEEVGLIQDTDNETNDSTVSLMTVHASKGLEFKHVYIIGLVDGIFPHNRSFESSYDMEEERRLMYVAMTRAQESLTLSYSQVHSQYGQRSYMPPSRFLSEITTDVFDSPQSLPVQKTQESSYEYFDDYLEYAKTPGFSIGDTIEHAYFGIGRIMSIQNNKLLIEFEDRSQKTFDARMAPIKKLDFL